MEPLWYHLLREVAVTGLQLGFHSIVVLFGGVVASSICGVVDRGRLYLLSDVR